MGWEQHLFIGVGLLLLLFSLRVPVAVALGIVGLVGLTLSANMDLAFNAFSQVVQSSPRNWLLVSVPLFVLMAEILIAGGYTAKAYDAFHKLLRGTPAAMPVATIGLGGLLAAISGSSAANVASLGRVSISEMLKRGYPKPIAAGSVAAAGGLGIIIPPSIPAILYAYVNEISVTRLFAAGIAPGALLVAGNIVLTVLALRWMKRWRSAAEEDDSKLTIKERGKAFVVLLPLLALIGVVLGVIYTGFATPTEAAAIGVAAAFVLVLTSGGASRAAFSTALRTTVTTSSFILFILIGAVFFVYYWTFAGVPQGVSAWVVEAGFPPYVLILAVVLTMVVLGAFMDTIALIFVATPVFAAVLPAAGFDPILTGIMLLLAMEIGLNTPPVGLNLFILLGVTKDLGISYGEVLRGSLLYLIPEILLVLVLPLLPLIALFLPDLLH